MESKTKYHIPKESELFEGYKFELQVYDYDTDEYKDEWEPQEFDIRAGLGHDEYHTFTEGRVRVPFITPDQVFECGWNPLEYLKHPDRYAFEKGNLFLILDLIDQPRIEIIYKDPGKVKDHFSVPYMNIQMLCPTINDLNKILSYVEG